jgi:hypothetical protein
MFAVEGVGLGDHLGAGAGLGLGHGAELAEAFPLAAQAVQPRRHRVVVAALLWPRRDGPEAGSPAAAGADRPTAAMATSSANASSATRGRLSVNGVLRSTVVSPL